MSEALDLADQLMKSIESGDVDAVRSIYATDAVIWHNFDNVEQTPDENLRTLTWMVKNVGDVHYEDIRRHETAEGYVQQHTFCGTAASGEAVRAPCCLIVRVEEGRITRLEEYLDPAQFAPLFKG
jgi:ketosteroid isomerase-like protein